MQGKCNTFFESIGYTVQYYEDLSANDIYVKIRELKMTDHPAFDSFVMYYSGYGTNRAIFGGEKAEIKEDSDMLEICDLVDSFQNHRCASLKGKPKLFFWDCCVFPQPHLYSPTNHFVSNSQEGISSGQFFDVTSVLAGNKILSSNDEPAHYSYDDFLYCFSVAKSFMSFDEGSSAAKQISIWTYFLQKRLLNKYDKRDGFHLEKVLSLVNGGHNEVFTHPGGTRK
eukprot:TRINITY_DN1531_c0_g1_i1.p1 TRINITY_DN1531_c0_g1~~TRINITY_DN1531_c0_g1_i1.p1  ORF type:complete len:226 (+),score=28.64 TRINITY_DN1531_c0_g1_i1:308-985(+)